VNGELRIGFFSKRPIAANEELTFDYQFQKVGKEQQKCYCGSEKCRGYLGVSSNNNNTNQQQSSGGAFDHIWDDVSDDDDDEDDSDENKSDNETMKNETKERKRKEKETLKQKRKSSNKEDFEVFFFWFLLILNCFKIESI